ncbi:MAG TPA: 4-hydroxythreonine-4-phosphate dehydrogenase PdxA [Alphaproteobacteria bacterium]
MTARPLALTMGEPAGIGGDITLMAWQRRADIPCFFAIDDPERLRKLAQRIGIATRVQSIAAPAEAAEVYPSALPVLPIEVAPVAPGQPNPAAARAVVESIRRAVDMVVRGVAGAVVTNPINKAALYETGFDYPGHTEFLAALAGLKHEPAMMLACESLRVVPVTIHLSLRAALAALTMERIAHAGRLTIEALRRDFAIARPRLAIAGLNPHAGESGHMGTEEIDIIAPAVAALKRTGAEIIGPLPPDTMFHDRARAGYDAALCMYHDQALIPIKTIDFDGAVNVTLGLPFVRTSPDHGTAFDIAGTGRANPASLIAALRLAARMAETRASVAQRASAAV